MDDVPEDRLRPVLHGLRLLGFATVEVLADHVDDDTVEVHGVLRHAEASGWTVFRDGRMTGWSLTTNGRSYGEQLLAAELDAAMRRGAVRAHYDEFLVLNPQFLELCTDWQVRRSGDDLVTNDHADPSYDEEVLARLADIDDAAQGLLERLAAELDRFDPYRQRFATARSRLEAGELDWFTRPTIDSYHTVWFQLHEDLLATLGLDRTLEH
ncbi:MAG: hypothetical protein U0Q22_15660 [Acidimicrobiales bacterium]